MNVVMHLGGNANRALTAIKVATELREKGEDYFIFVSSEGDEAGCQAMYDAAGHGDRVIFDDAAWCTVTNFTHTYKRVLKLKPKTIWVVTDDFHMPRSREIARQVWGGRAKLRYAEHPANPERTEHDAQYIPWNKARSFGWRRFGVHFYWKNVIERRGWTDRLNKGHALVELPISEWYWLAYPCKLLSDWLG